MGFDANLHFTINASEKKIYDIIFIGHWEPNTEKYLMKLNFKVKIDKKMIKIFLKN